MDKIKNIITNILGLVFWVLAIKDANSNEPDITFIVTLIIVGFILFLFKIEVTKNFIKRYLDEKIDK